MLALILSAMMFVQPPVPFEVYDYAGGTAVIQRNPQYPLITYVGVVTNRSEGRPDRVIAYEPGNDSVLEPGVYVSMWINGRHLGYRLGENDPDETIDQLIARLRSFQSPSLCPGGRCYREEEAGRPDG